MTTPGVSHSLVLVCNEDVFHEAFVTRKQHVDLSYIPIAIWIAMYASSLQARTSEIKVPTIFLEDHSHRATFLQDLQSSVSPLLKSQRIHVRRLYDGHRIMQHTSLAE